MFKELRKIYNLKSLSLDKLGDKLIYTINNITYINEKSFNMEMSPLEFSAYRNRVFYSMNENLYEIKNCEFVEFIHIQDSDRIHIINENIVLSFKWITRKEIEYSIYDTNTNLLWKQANNMRITIFENYLLINERFNKKEFIVKDAYTGNVLWHFSLPEGFKIFSKIQLVENVLFFTAYKDINRYKKVFGLDIHTGKTLWEYNFQIPYKENIIAFHINPENNLSYGYGGRLYQVFDPVNGKIVFEKDMSDYYEQGVEPDLHRNSISDGRLWFVSGYGENAKFGAININTHEVEFIQDYPLELDYRFHKIIFHQNKLYVSDSGNTLHIFEKTSDEQV